MDFLTLAMLVALVAIIAGFGVVAFGKWTESRERIALGTDSREVLQRLDRLEEEVARIQSDQSTRIVT